MNMESCRRAVIDRLPDFEKVEFKALPAGWDCDAVEAGGYVFKFPRSPRAARALEKEARTLDLVASAVTMVVPRMMLYSGAPVFSQHRMIPGEPLITSQYDAMPEAARGRLATELAVFYAELHGMDEAALRDAGVQNIPPAPDAETTLEQVWSLLPPDLQPHVRRLVDQWRDLPTDPHGDVFGYFDGHGWNMAFDHARWRLNGMYDFGDSGFGPLHFEFVQPSWISPELTERTIVEYERLTARPIDRDRVAVLTGSLRLAELAEFGRLPEHGPVMLRNLSNWISHCVSSE